MQVFSTFFKIAKKQLGVCSIYLVVFIVLIVMMSNLGVADNQEGYVGTKCNVAVFDRDESNASRNLVQYLESKNNIIQVKDDKDEILNRLYYETLDYVLYIEEGYSETGELSNIKRPGSNTGSNVDNDICIYENSIKSLLTAGYTLDEAYNITIDALDSSELVSLRGKSSSGKSMGYYFFLYFSYVITMVLFTGLAPILVAFNKKEVSDRTNIAPIKSKSRSIQLIAGSLLFCIGCWLLFTLIAIILYRESIFEGRNVVLILNSLIYVIVIMGAVNITGSFNLSQQSITMIANIVGLGTSFLGGVFVPTEIFSDGLVAVSRFLPTYWYVKAQDYIMDNRSMSEVMSCFGVELLFALVLIVVSMLVTKRMRISRAS